MGVVPLNGVLDTHLGFWDIQHMYNIICTRDEGSYHLKTQSKNRKLVTHSPNFARGDNDNFLIITSNWEEKDEEGRPSGLHVPTPLAVPVSPSFPLIY